MKKYLIFDFDGTISKFWKISEKNLFFLKKIKEKNYFLFITSRSSSRKINKILEKYEIKKLFEIVYGSEEVLKSVEHIEYFEDYSCDSDFREKAVIIWDWEIDKNLAQESKIDFIYVWEDGLTSPLAPLLLGDGNI